MNADGIASMLEAVEELSPLRPVSTLLMEIERQRYITESESVGSIPPPLWAGLSMNYPPATMG